MIRYDKTQRSVLVYCTCGWRELCLTQNGAWRVAEHHEAAVHPSRDQVRAAQVRRVHRGNVRVAGEPSEDAD